MTDSSDKIELFKENALSEAISHGELDTLIKPLIKEIHLFDTFVAGTSYLKDKTVLDNLKIGDSLSLVREDNKFDSNAILVLNNEKKKLGYVPEKDNVVFARLMDAGKMLKARISKLDNKGSFRQITIGIYLVDY